MKNLSLTVLIIIAFVSSLDAQKRPVRRTIPRKTDIIQRIGNAQTSAPKLGVAFEKYISTTDINADGTATQTLETVQRVTSEIALDKFNKYERVFNGDLQKVEVLEAQILKADGKKIPVPAEAVQIKLTAQAEAAPDFSSLKLLEIKFNDFKVGDASAVKVRIHTTKPYFAKHFDDIDVFPAVYEWKSIEVNVSAPTDFPLYTQANNLDGGKLSDENGRARWRWTKQNLPAVELETAMFDFYENSPKVAVTSFKNYEELGAAYWSEAVKKSTVTPEIQTLADEITKDIKEPQAQAYAIYEWANKNVRYLSIVLERGGWIPHDATQILANRYGDCKDYSTLLNALLRAKNIESYPVIIRADMTNWFPEVAVPSFFNHAILYIPTLDLFADATAPNTRLGLIPQAIVGKRAFLAGTKNGVIKVPDGKPEDNQISSESEINFAADGSLKAVSKNVYQGRAEIIFRPLFSDSYLQKNSESFVKLLLGYYGIDGTGKISKIANPFKVGEPFEIEMQTEQNNFTAFNKIGSLRVPTGINMVNMLELESFVKEEKRQTNLTMGATRVSEKFKLNLPVGITVENLPETIDFKTANGFFRSEFKLNGGTIEIARELVISKDVFTPTEYPQLRELIKKMVDSFNHEIKYRAADGIARSNRRQTARKPPRAKSFEEMIADEISKKTEQKPLTARQVLQFEAKLKQNPADIETRRQLLKHYDDSSFKLSAVAKSAFLKHRLWFVENHPEMNEFEIYGALGWNDSNQPEYKLIKSAWLKQIETNPKNHEIRLNAANFIRYADAETAEKILIDGTKISPESYEIPVLLNKIYQHEADDSDNADKPEIVKTNRQKAFETGETALRLLKQERSEERDGERRDLLKTLSKTALKIGKIERAEQLATELVLDFGQNAGESDYESATHIGNIVLGLAALEKGDAAKAGNYLLIAIRAPLRDETNYLTEIDTELAKKLFETGEKNTVAEYLKLCEGLRAFKLYANLYEDEIKALKLWQEQIKQGKTPSFDFDQP